MRHQTTDELPGLRALLHVEGDSMPVQPGSWQQIQERLPQPSRGRRAARGLVPLVVGAAVVAVVATVVTVVTTTSKPGSPDSVLAGNEPPAVASATANDVFWTAPGDPGSDPAETARRFVASLGLPLDQLTADPVSDNAVTVRESGRALGRVVLTTLPDGSWGVTGMASSELAVRSPRTDDRFDPPMSVSFRSTSDGDVVINLYAAGRPAPLSVWQGAVDARQDWFSQSNFAATQARHAYVALIRSQAGEADAVTVVRVQLGDAS